MQASFVEIGKTTTETSRDCNKEGRKLPLRQRDVTSRSYCESSVFDDEYAVAANKRLKLFRMTLSCV